MLNMIVRLFPLWAILLSVLAYFQPDWFTPVKPYIANLLALIMLSMGLTLLPKDFVNVGRYWQAVAVGVGLQFSIMPIAALLISRALNLSTELTVGMILVGAVAGGTASNVMCYLAKADVAMSVSMTAISTLLGVFLTPLLISWLAGTLVEVNAQAMMISLAKIVLLPVGLGLLLNWLFHRQVTRLEPVLPLIAMVAIITIIAAVIGLSVEAIKSSGLVVLLAVFLHNGTGLLLGYWACRLLGFQKQICKTIAFEVGLQNSGLAVTLAGKFFTAGAALPGAIFSIWHNISGSILAAFWAKADQEEPVKAFPRQKMESLH